MKIKEYINKTKYFEFYIFNIDSTSTYYEDLIEVFSEIIINPLVVVDNNHTIIVSNEIDSAVGVPLSLFILLFFGFLF